MLFIEKLSGNGLLIYLPDRVNKSFNCKSPFSVDVLQIRKETKINNLKM